MKFRIQLIYSKFTRVLMNRTASSVILVFMVFSFFGCKRNESSEQSKDQMLTQDFSSFENFFPIKTLDLRKKGIKDKIHVMYVSFDPDIDQEKAFPGDDYIDEFTFKITSNGLFHPTFDKTALKIGKDFKDYFDEGKAKYLNLKNKNTLSPFVDTYIVPDWWQYDQTPVNSKGEKMKFICQLDADQFFNDDCRIFIFYDEDDRVVKYIYQRT
ncbi:hypothetical protein D3C87_233900 [compost metagenome]